MDKWVIYILTIFSLHFISNFGFVSTKCLKNEKTINWNRSLHVDNKTVPITIDVTNRKSHRIVSHILKILLTEKLLYKDVRFKYTPWFSPAETLDRLHGKRGKLPEALINMEVWQPPGFNVEKWVNQGLVLDCGPLGPIARRGIFGRTETINRMFNTYNKSLDHWRTFLSPLPTWNYTVMYEWLIKTKKWEPPKSLLQKDVSSVPIVLVDRQDFKTSIERLLGKVYTKAFFRVVLVPNVKDSLEETIDDWIKYADNISHPQDISPIFFYDWYPSAVTVNRSYSRVLFPDCYGIKNDPLCDFEINQLSKMVWVKLKSHALLIFQLINHFKMSQLDLVNLLNKVGDKWNENDYENLACDWIKKNSESVTAWTVGWDQKEKLMIPGLFSLYGKWVPDGLIELGRRELYNQNKKLFNTSSYELYLDIKNLTCEEDIVLKEYFRTFTSNRNSSIILAFLAAVCSDSLEATLKVSTFQRRVVITSTADSPKFGNISQYKYFFRTLPSMKIQMFLLLSVFRHWHWKRIVILRKDSMFFEKNFFERSNITVIRDNEVLESQLTFDDMFKFLKRMRDEENARIFLVEYFAESTRIIMCAAYKLNMSFSNGYIWFLNSWMNESWNNMTTKNCTEKEMLNITSTYFHIAHRSNRRYGPTIGANINLSLKPETPFAREFKDFTVEAIQKIAQATNKLINENPSALSIIDSPIIAEKFISYIANLESDKNEPRLSDIVEGYWILFATNSVWKIPMLQWEFASDFSFNKSKNLFDKPTIKLDGNSLRKFWGSGNNYTCPSDGTLVTEPPSCILEGFRKFLGVQCSISIIIFNLIIIVPILIIIIGCFFFFFRRLQRTQELEGIRKPFEFLCEELAGLDLPGKDVVINRTVGRGNFGIVYGGEARQDNKWVLVAIKAISKKLDFRHKLEFLSEAKLMSNLNHENIVKLIGICLNPDNDMIYLIMEHVTGGDLKKFLIKRRVKAKEDPTNDIICPERLTKYARDIASGLLYLHQNRYLHRDVACRNCLISADYCIKVGDFGLARKMIKFSRKAGNGYYRFSGLGAMPIRWLPPESLQFGIYSVATDIWSYGVTLYEIVTFGVFPFGGYEHEEVVDKVKRCRFTVANFLPDSFKSTKVYEIISKCCSYNAGERYKSMDEIIEELDNNTQCVQPSLTDDPPNIQQMGFSTAIGSESNPFLPRKIPTRSTKYLSEISAGHNSVPSYIYSSSEPLSKDTQIDIQIRAKEDFINAFCSLEGNSSMSPTLSLEQPLNMKSQSTEYIHLTNAIANAIYAETPRNNDLEADQGYVTYKTAAPPDSTLVQPSSDSGNIRINYLKMSAKSNEPDRPETKALTKHSCSLDLSTDTGCSDADYSTDKQSPINAGTDLNHSLSTSVA